MEWKSEFVARDDGPVALPRKSSPFPFPSSSSSSANSVEEPAAAACRCDSAAAAETVTSAFGILHVVLLRVSLAIVPLAGVAAGGFAGLMSAE